MEILFQEEVVGGGTAFDFEVAEAEGEVAVDDVVVGDVGVPLGDFVEFVLAAAVVVDAGDESELAVGYVLIMFHSFGAVIFADGVEKDLAFFGTLDRLQKLEVVVQVIVEDDEVVVFLQFMVEVGGAAEAFGGAGDDFEGFVFVADIGFQDGGIDEDLVHAVVGDFHDEIAERVMEVFFFEEGIGPGKAARDFEPVVALDGVLDVFVIGISKYVSAAVPNGVGEGAVDGGDVDAVVKHVRIGVELVDEGLVQVELKEEVRDVVVDGHPRVS
jgi:hypothetical protein